MFTVKATWRAPGKMHPHPEGGMRELDSRRFPDMARAPEITIVTDITLDDPIAETMRFNLTRNGTFFLGDIHTVLHVDIGIATSHLPEKEEGFIIGVLQFKPELGIWWCHTQPNFEKPTILFPRLSTWHDLIGQQEVKIFDGYSSDAQFLFC
jgi:hypothetical protein